MSLTINCDTRGLEVMLQRAAEDIDTVVRPAAQAGAQVVYDYVVARAPQSDHGHWFYGTNKRYWFEAGTLTRSIYQVYSKDNSGKDHATYHISWNYRECPYGFMVEYGTANAPAHPFIRPGQNAFPRALDAAVNEANWRLDALGL
jgi:HK97 gp10 family phage protein